MIVSTQGTLSEHNRSVSISALSLIVSAFTALVAAVRTLGTAVTASGTDVLKDRSGKIFSAES